MAVSLNCPNCGAATQADSARCEYCGAGLTAAPCPSCLASIWKGSDYCPRCGKKLEAAVADAAGPAYACPGCGGEMPHQVVGAIPMNHCTACDSIWLDPSTFVKLCTDQGTRGTVMAALDLYAAPTGPAKLATGSVRYVHCPVCQKIMNRSNFGHTSNIVIDVCKGHGAWFEHGELHGVLQFAAAGGLERQPALNAAQMGATNAVLGMPVLDDSRVAERMADVQITIGVHQHDRGLLQNLFDLLLNG